MIDGVRDECGLVAAADLGRDVTGGRPVEGDGNAMALVPAMLLDIQNRGQLAAGFTVYNPEERRLLRTRKEVGSVKALFRLGDPVAHRALVDAHRGPVAIAHTRYATCGAEDPDYAQPFERVHGKKFKWFSFCFNGNVANHQELAAHLAGELGYHLIRLDCDTELFMHYLASRQRGGSARDWAPAFRRLGRIVDGAWSMALLTADGDLVLARDATGIKPLCYGFRDRWFLAASESVALQNAGVAEIHDVPPGTMIHVRGGKVRHHPIAAHPRPTHCFFEWAYFANVASVIDGCSVYRARTAMGRALAAIEEEKVGRDHVVVPVPDTAKPAGDAFAYALGIPSIEGLVRNRYAGDRTFIEGSDRRAKVARKFVVLRGVIAGKKVFLVDDSLVRSTTIEHLADYVRREGRAREVHVRVASPPIMGPCFYGVDMSSIGELFAPRFVSRPVPGVVPARLRSRMAGELRADSLQYLPVKSLSRCIGKPAGNLCTACVDRRYPTRAGRELFERAVAAWREGRGGRMTTCEPSCPAPGSCASR